LNGSDFSEIISYILFYCKLFALSLLFMPNIHVNENVTTVSLISYIWDLVYCVCKDSHFMVRQFPHISKQNQPIIVKFEYFFFCHMEQIRYKEQTVDANVFRKHNKHKYFRLNYIVDFLLIFELPIPFHSHCFENTVHWLHPVISCKPTDISSDKDSVYWIDNSYTLCEIWSCRSGEC